MIFGKFALAIYLPAVKARKRSWNLDERIIYRHILPVFGQKRLSAIASLEVEAWQRDLAGKGLAGSSCNRIISVFRNILALARSHGLCSGKPEAAIRPFPVKTRLNRHLSGPEAHALWRELQKHESKAALALRLILLTGCRKSEILKARWENVNLDNAMLAIPLSKSGQPRFVPLSAEAVGIMEKMRKVTRSPWLFPGRAGDKPVADIYYFWNSLRKRLKMENVRIHDLRHTFASLLLASGHSLYEAQSILGHRDSRSTMIYAHLDNERLIAAVNKASYVITDGKTGKKTGRKADMRGKIKIGTCAGKEFQKMLEKIGVKLVEKFQEVMENFLLEFQC